MFAKYYIIIEKINGKLNFGQSVVEFKPLSVEIKLNTMLLYFNSCYNYFSLKSTDSIVKCAKLIVFTSVFLHIISNALSQE